MLRLNTEKMIDVSFMEDEDDDICILYGAIRVAYIDYVNGTIKAIELNENDRVFLKNNGVRIEDETKSIRLSCALCSSKL